MDEKTQAQGGRRPDPGPRTRELSELGEGDVLQFLLLHHDLDGLNDVLGLQHAHIPGSLGKEGSEVQKGKGRIGVGPMKNGEIAAHQSEDKAWASWT